MENQQLSPSNLDFWEEKRKKVAFYLEDIETPLGKTINLTLTGIILISLASFIAQTYPLSPNVRSRLELLDFIILILFTIEYFIRFWAAENKKKFVLDPLSLIDLLIIIQGSLRFLNISYLRIFRWFRVLRLIRFIDVKISVFRIQTEDGIIFARIIFTLLTIIFIFSGLIYQVEHPVNPEIFKTFLDAVYFSVVTMTTVGFGDVTPLSEMGRFLTILMILTGIALIPWQLGDLIKQLVKASNHIDTICVGCGWSVHDQDARFCKRCGTPLNPSNS
ncbi:Voltage-gated potassium channel [Planktothrix tepida]|uniref:Ion transport 2 domain protein n=1 Tax=Planktothrix tepida PCC 9214 TaxID=671072 RepID=A0A1J1LI00_9CYAN|nr:ion transporter [Planktothrix tepida]CAD5910629.1 Voltage-gated potassium channel [Planktothrix tepida]CUR32115.1 Ion transport 2 domain protein [Planktothrix tepida PCC 9214]